MTDKEFRKLSERQQDIFVAKKIFKKSAAEIKAATYEGDSTLYSRVMIYTYTTSISSAWLVVLEMYRLGWDFELEVYESNKGPKTRAGFLMGGSNEFSSLAFGPTSQTICIAALIALGHLEEII